MTLKEWLEDNGLSARELAKRLGCSRIVLYKIDRKIPIDKHFAEKIKLVTKGAVIPVEGKRNRSYHD